MFIWEQIRKEGIFMFEFEVIEEIKYHETALVLIEKEHASYADKLSG